MNLDIAILNVVPYLTVFLMSLRSQKELTLFSIIIFAYLMTAIFGCILINSNISVYPNLSIFNFIYLFICVLIFVWPFRYAKFTATNITIIENRWINLLLIVYFISGVIVAFYGVPRTIATAQIDDWAQVRNQVYTDADSIEYYSSTFEKLAKNVYTYLTPFGIVMIFYQFSKKEFNAIATIALLAIWGINTYCDSTVMASRGMVVFSALNLALAFIMFRKAIPAKRKKIIYIIAIGFAIFFYTYISAVSEARFKHDSNDMALWYVGQSMNVFNQDIMTPMHDFAYGKYFFKWFIELFGGNPDIDFEALGSTHGVQFMTFIGCFYVDFGPLGTIIVGLIMCRLLMNFTRKSHYYLSDLIIIAYYANWYINGVMVVGRSQSLPWAMLFIVYFIVRNMETRINRRNNRISKNQE